MSTCLWWLRITCAYFIKKKWYKCTLKLQSDLKLLVTTRDIVIDFFLSIHFRNGIIDNREISFGRYRKSGANNFIQH